MHSDIYIVFNSLAPRKCGCNFTSIISELISKLDILNLCSEVALRRFPQDPTLDKSTSREPILTKLRLNMASLGDNELKCWSGLSDSLSIVRLCEKINPQHYSDVIMTTLASQITSLTVVYSIVYSDAYQRKHQSSASLAFVWGIHRDRWLPRTRGSYAENISIWWRHHGSTGF